MYKISLEKVRCYNFAKHHIGPGYQSESIIEVAWNLVGLHSARLSTPYVTLYSRVKNFQTKEFRDFSFVSRNLVRVRCMRKTLHTVPLDLAPIVHQATVSFRVADCLHRYRQLEITEPLIEKIREAVIAIVRNEPTSSQKIQELIQQNETIGSGTRDGDFWKRLTRAAIKHLWEEGTLCYLNTSEHWGSEKRLYGYTSLLYPTLYLQALSPHEAQQWLVYYHIDRFGPVTEADICWWSGLSRHSVRTAIAGLQDLLCEVDLEGFNSTFYMTAPDVERLTAFDPTKDRWLCLLAYEDPSLKGYFESRTRYIAPRHYHTLFNQIGEARASIVLNGEVIGIWEWDKSKRRVVWNTFETISPEFLTVLRIECERLEQCLNNGFIQHSFL